jgi:hypothetical protein
MIRRGRTEVVAAVIAIVTTTSGNAAVNTATAVTGVDRTRGREWRRRRRWIHNCRFNRARCYYFKVLCNVSKEGEAKKKKKKRAFWIGVDDRSLRVLLKQWIQYVVPVIRYTVLVLFVVKQGTDDKWLSENTRNNYFSRTSTKRSTNNDIFDRTTTQTIWSVLLSNNKLMESTITIDLHFVSR